MNHLIEVITFKQLWAIGFGLLVLTIFMVVTR